MPPSARPFAIAGVTLFHLLVSLCNAVAFGAYPPNEEWSFEGKLFWWFNCTHFLWVICSLGAIRLCGYRLERAKAAG